MDFCDCTESCKSKLHGDDLSSVLTKRNVTDGELCAYLKQICHNCEQVRDNDGRTALHVAASMGRVDVIRWLLKRKSININIKDFESGYTPLHRSIYSGKIQAVVRLLQGGATALSDNEGLTFIDHAMKNVPFCKEEEYGFVYTWGTNVNYVFGMQQARNVPELWDSFHKDNSVDLVSKIYLEKFHCLIVTKSGKAYSSGHGQGGRLGLSSEQTILKPTLISFVDKQLGNVECISASAGRDHTVFLTRSDTGKQVWTCGLNTHCVLGINPPPQIQLSPKRLTNIKNAQGVSASRYHSAVWTEKTLFTWGLHGGQLGHDTSSEKYIISPKLVTKLKIKSDVQKVVTSFGATVVLTSTGDLLIFHEYRCKTISSKQQLLDISVIGGKLNTSLDTSLLAEKNSELKIAVITRHGKILLWQESCPYLTQCILSLNREVIATQVTLTSNGILFIDNEGEAFTGTIKPKKKQDQQSNAPKQMVFNKFLEKDECHHIKVIKLQHIHRAISIASDPRGSNFAVIQGDPKSGLIYPVSIQSSAECDYRTLLDESEPDDYIHDVQFQVGYRTFAAHRYILANKSNINEKFTNTINKITNIHPDIFQELLIWIYTGNCSLLKVGQCPVNFLHINEKQKNAVRVLQDVAKEFGVSDLEKRLSKLTINGGRIEYSKGKSDDGLVANLAYDRSNHPELYDISIVAKNGQVLKAHRCILVARADFFQKMYSNRWNTTPPSGKIQLPFTYVVLELFLEYIYTDEIKSAYHLDVDTVCHLLELSDQYLIARLRNLCEIVLCNMLTFKNAVQLLALSAIYNANELKEYVMTFICSNLAMYLELKSLECLDDDLLDDLTQFYCSNVEIMQNRIITPYSTAPSDENVKMIAGLCPVSSSDLDIEVKSKSSKSHRSRLRSHKDSVSDLKDSFNDTKDSISRESFTEEEIMDKQINKRDFDERNKDDPVVARIRAITTAQEKLKQERDVQQFVRLSSSPKNDFTADDFPSLGNTKSTGFVKINRQNSVDKHRMPKLSQRQRKASEESVKEIFTKPESPRNPWKINEIQDIAKSPEKVEVVNMGEILMQEKQQKENFNKMISKPLMYTQIEDKAIEELQKFYNCSNSFEEDITMERVYNYGAVVYPTWINKVK